MSDTTKAKRNTTENNYMKKTRSVGHLNVSKEVGF